MRLGKIRGSIKRFSVWRRKESPRPINTYFYSTWLILRRYIYIYIFQTHTHTHIHTHTYIYIYIYIWYIYYIYIYIYIPSNRADSTVFLISLSLSLSLSVFLAIYISRSFAFGRSSRMYPMSAQSLSKFFLGRQRCCVYE